MRDTVRSLLKRRCMRQGLDPDDPPPFWPAQNLTPGIVPIGRILLGPESGPTFALPQSVLTQHVGIFGYTGTGKSFLGMHLAHQLLRAGQRVWTMDLEDEYSRLISLVPEGDVLALGPEHLRFNFFEPPGPWISPSQWVNDLALLLRGQLFLRDGSLNVFTTGMGKLLQRKGATEGEGCWPSFVEVIEYFRGLGFGPKSRSAGFLESLLNRLGMLADTFGRTARVATSRFLSDLAGRSVIFRLHGLTGIPLQFLVSFLLLWLARYREGTESDEAQHVVILEEAHMLASERARIDVGESVLCTTFRTARKRGIALVLCDQVPSELPAPVLANLGCRVIMRILSSRCLWSVQSSMGLSRYQADAIPELQNREAVVQYELYPQPFMIRVPELSFPPRLPEADLQERAELALARADWSEYMPEPGRPSRPVAATVVGPDELAGDALLVMVRICEAPAETIEDRCTALGMDRAREFRARGELDGRGLVAEAPQAVGGKTKFFVPTDKGVAWAERHKIRVKRYKSGVVHEYLLNQVQRRIGAVAPNWRFQRSSSVGRDQGLQPDLLVLAPEGQRIVIEICCNNLDYDAENLAAEAAIADVDRVVAVTPDNRTAKRLESALAKAAERANTDRQNKVAILNAGKCLGTNFDWEAVLLEPPAPDLGGQT
jgi:hypothetical protein